MITNTNNVGSSPIPSPDPRRNRAGVAAPSVPATETLSTENATTLKAALENSPAIRSEVVARASELAVDSAYPPLAIIQKVARMISNSIDLSAE